MANFIRFNLFPLSVHVIDADGNQVNEHPKARGIVTDDEVFVYVDSSDGPVVLYEERIDDFTGSAKTGWTVTTSDGHTVQFQRTQGCACGSRLKGFNPFPGVPYERNI